jgi:hypothetical protein
MFFSQLLDALKELVNVLGVDNFAIGTLILGIVLLIIVSIVTTKLFRLADELFVKTEIGEGIVVKKIHEPADAYDVTRVSIEGDFEEGMQYIPERNLLIVDVGEHRAQVRVIGLVFSRCKEGQSVALRYGSGRFTKRLLIKEILGEKVI